MLDSLAPLIFSGVSTIDSHCSDFKSMKQLEYLLNMCFQDIDDIQPTFETKVYQNFKELNEEELIR